MSVSYIGGADGPTSVFVAGNVGSSWFNGAGLVVMLLIMIPNIVYGIKFKGEKNKCTSKVMNIIEQVGRFASMFLMVFHVGILELPTNVFPGLLLYVPVNFLLLVAYWTVWLFYFCKRTMAKALALAILPTLIFLFTGILLGQYLLVVSAVIFGIGHIFVTYKNALDFDK